jgi:phage gpG-like protein
MAAGSLTRRGPIGFNLDVELLPSTFIVVSEFELMALKFTNFKEPLTKAIKEIVIPSIAKNFEEEGRPEHWAELADFTLTRREEEGYGSGPILERSGKLKRAAQAFARWKITMTEASFASFAPSQWYGYLMQEGSDAVGSNVPARPFMLMQEEDVDEIEKLFGDWMKKIFSEGGFV